MVQNVTHTIHDALSLVFSPSSLFCPVSVYQIIELYNVQDLVLGPGKAQVFSGHTEVAVITVT